MILNKRTVKIFHYSTIAMMIINALAVHNHIISICEDVGMDTGIKLFEKELRKIKKTLQTIKK